MTIRKLLSLVLALMLCTVCALAEGTDLQAQLDAANARIAELEAQVELYKPYYDKNIAVEYDGGVIDVDEAMEIYNYYEEMFAQYGVNLADYGYESYYKQIAAEETMNERALKINAAALGLDVLPEEQEAELREQAASNMESYISSYIEYTYGDAEVTDEMRAEAIEALDSTYGYSEQGIYDSLKDSLVDEQVYNYVIADVAVNDEDIQATYDELVAQDESNYANEASYVSARTAGNTILWHPEGYRMIKQVLVKFDDDQSSRYSDIKSTMTSLQSELAALENAEEGAEVRTAEEIQADIDATQGELDALYAEQQPKVQEIVEAFNGGTAFEDLIAQYNDDKGQPEEGYPVTADSTYFDPAFANAAMAITEIGGIGEPANGSYGTYITYYSADVVPGAVPLEDVKDYVEQTALENKKNTVYTETLNNWVTALNPVYHMENMK